MCWFEADECRFQKYDLIVPDDMEMRITVLADVQCTRLENRVRLLFRTADGDVEIYLDSGSRVIEATRGTVPFEVEWLGCFGAPRGTSTIAFSPAH